MRTRKLSIPRAHRSLLIGAVVGAALLAAPAVEAQQLGQHAQSAQTGPAPTQTSADILRQTGEYVLTVAVWTPEGELASGARVSAALPDGSVVKGTELSDSTYLVVGLGAKTTLEVEHFDLGRSRFEVILPTRIEEAHVYFHSLDHAEISLPSPTGSSAVNRGPPPGPPANDLCANAIPLTMPDILVGSTLGASADAAPFCGTSNTAPGIWYSVVGNGNQFFATTCGPTFDYDTKISIYTDGCGTLTCVTGNDDDCGTFSLLSTVGWTSEVGREYLILVHGFGTASGEFTLILSQAEPPAGDTCGDATDLNVPDITVGSTSGAGIDDDFPLCGTSITAAGVWYHIVGTGTTITATTCNAASFYDTKISVYCSTCEDPICVSGNDDSCGGGFSGLLSTVSWCSEAGADYYILVHGFGTAEGDFSLIIADDGVPCDDAIACIPTGACCLPGGECADGLTAAECEAAGGVYQGDGVACVGEFVDYTIALSGNAFEDISGTGNAGPTLDDSSVMAPLGFAFNFFGDAKTDVLVSSNGYLTFGLVGTDFSNDPIPSTADPDDAIFPLWDDFNPGDGGAIFYETRGVAPNRRFIAQWDTVAEFGSGGTDTATFQAVLFEADSSIEFRYGPLVRVPTSPGDATIGVENDDGTVGYGIPDSLAQEGSAYVWTPSFVGAVDCCVTLDFETDDGGAPLANGQDISTPPEFGNIVAISSSGAANNGAAIYDSDIGGPNDPGADPNLLVDQGNVLILQDVNAGAQTVPGIFDVPNDAGGGGRLILDFLAPFTVIESVDLLDIDPGFQDASVTLVDGSGNERVYDVPAGWTADGGVGTLDLTTLAAQPGVSAVATASQDAGFDASDIVQMVVFMRSSGAIDNVRLCP